MSETLTLAKSLIQIASVTPEDGGCQQLLQQRLGKLGFNIIDIPFEQTQNFFAVYGDKKPLVAFAGHTDVVEPGPIENWHSDPFVAEIRDGYLFGRGAADMKGSVAAMIVACEQFLQQHASFSGSIAFLITSAEEGPSEQGTPQIIKYLQQHDIHLDYCIVGEPTANKQVGDHIKNGRRGSLNAKLTVHGKQGHIAYPHLANNPILTALPALTELSQQHWDQGNVDFQPTSLQISNLHAGCGAINVIPGELESLFNFRYSPESTAEQLEQHTHTILDKHELNYSIDWDHSGKPFYTATGRLIEVCKKSIADVCQIQPSLSTSGGTSDGRFITDICSQLLELGPCNETIHQVNESVKVEDLELLTAIYQKVLHYLLIEEHT